MLTSRAGTALGLEFSRSKRTVVYPCQDDANFPLQVEARAITVLTRSERMRPWRRLVRKVSRVGPGTSPKRPGARYGRRSSPGPYV